MLRARSTIAFLFALLALISLPSCMEVEQDIWINEDGSGTAKLKMGISKQTLKMAANIGGESTDTGDPFDIDELEKAIEADDNVTASEIREEEDDKYKYVVVDLSLADITKMGELLNSMAPDSPAGESDGGLFEIERTESGTYQITADMSSPNAAGDGTPENAMAAGMMKGMLGDAKFVFRVHNTPVSADSHNGKFEDGAVVWTIPLIDLMGGESKPIEGEFIPAKVSRVGDTAFWFILGAVLVVALILYFLFRAQRPKLN